MFGVVTTAAPNIAYAEEALNFDTTNVLDDLKSSSDGGEAFNLNDYARAIRYKWRPLMA